MTNIFTALNAPAPDALHAISRAYTADPRTQKLDLGVGVYRNEEGRCTAMKVVKHAEQVLAEANASKAYLPTRGHQAFLEGMNELLFAQTTPDSVASIQTVGGTGGIFLALELARRTNPDLTVHVGQPSWPNHFGICEQLGIPVRSFEHCDAESGLPSLEGHIRHLQNMTPGDFLVLQGPCHNPTGRDLSANETIAIIGQAIERGVTCLIDAAYYGLGNPLESDAKQLRKMILAAPNTMLVMSGSKTFGLYRDRIGILFVNCGAEKVDDIIAILGHVARATYSVPAAHGAQVIGHILGDDAAKSAWKAELAQMQRRVQRLRDLVGEVANGVPAFNHIHTEKGIFSLLPLNPHQVARFATEHAIYMAKSGRINIAGLNRETIPYLVKAVASLDHE